MTRPPATGMDFFRRAFLVEMEEVTQVVFVRHGEAAYGRRPEPGDDHDPTDPPLTDLGVRQAELAGERFSVERVDAIYASPLRRALDTAKAIARHHRMEPTVLDDLREVELIRDREAWAKVPPIVSQGIWERMVRERRWDVFPHGEGSADFRRRTVNAVEGIIMEHPGKRVVVVCHGGIINAYLAHILGTQADMVFQPANTSVTVVNAGEGLRALQSLNDITHLTTAEGSFHST